MKWIKKFESYGDDNEYYHIMSHDEKLEAYDKLVDFSEMDRMLDVLKDWELVRANYQRSKWGGDEVVRGVFRNNPRIYSDVYFRFEIFELVDEWFMVRLELQERKYIKVEEPTYNEYMCDQWEGVLKLLQDKKIIQDK
jgi:hypothetical protein